MNKLVFLLCVSLFSCADKADLNPVADDSPKTQAVGPYAVVIDPSSLVYEHTFRIDNLVNQAEGKVEYFIQTERKENLVLELAAASFAGCDVNNVKHQKIWFAQDTAVYGQLITTSTQFKTLRATKGKLIHNFTNLNGCTAMEFKTRIRQLPHAGAAGKACEGAASVQECRVDMYCREKYTTQFVEVEVWNRGGALTLQKYMNSGTGSRSLLLMTTARLSPSATSSSYVSTGASISASLIFENANLTGMFKENVAGHDYTTNLDCDM